MKFNKQHLVDIPNLTLLEVPVFINFLTLERARHIETAEMCLAWIELWQSELKRQKEEVEHIDRGAEEVRVKFKMEKK